MATLTETRRKPFYGWVIVAVGFTAQFISGLANQAFSTYLVPLGQEFGWSRAALAGPRSITQAETALMGPVDGFLVDRFGPRVVMTAGVLLLGLGMVSFGLVQEIWQYYAANVLIGLGTSLAGILVISTAVNSWFRRKRTLAMALTTVGFSVAGMVAIPLVVWVQTTMGWREAAIASGLVVWSIGLPAAAMLRRSPEGMGLLPDGDLPGPLDDAPTAAGGQVHAPGGGHVDFVLPEAVRTRAFWCIGFGNGLNQLIMSAVIVHLFVHLEEGVRISRGEAALAFTFMSAFNMAGRLTGGFLGDRYAKNLLLGAAMLGTGGALVLLTSAASLAPVFAFAGLYGFCWGMRTPLVNS
ncbi:MAG: MFS transporter, partial [Dehalococcoidia bacterium]